MINIEETFTIHFSGTLTNIYSRLPANPSISRHSKADDEYFERRIFIRTFLSRFLFKIQDAASRTQHVYEDSAKEKKMLIPASESGMASNVALIAEKESNYTNEAGRHGAPSLQE
ncbi:hypothetical protein CDAR_497471 [Caerostris darwini]|uniref:Uncharacterized protein n=1 Tax=Caerostris darwini TaxID=1538125 RepID=A0AAV4S5A9_9ARAC|nr:hypothetical protein CDAR_497471 [Caerostris darwini]